MSEQPVKLKYCLSETFSPGQGLTDVMDTEISAKVKNIAFEKSVAIHYAQFDGTWTEKELIWQDNFGDYDLFSKKDNSFVTNQFVIRYSVNGETFWDNNNGADYHLDNGHPNTIGRKVLLNKITAWQGQQGSPSVVSSWVDGEILVKNLSFNKRVGIRLSADGGATFHDTEATFSSTVPVYLGFSAVELWKFKTPEVTLDESTPHFKFAVYYNNVDTGEWFWDNNFDRDYTLSKENLKTAE
jgi:hypothetical protein